MTTKEKAEEIFNKYMIIPPYDITDGYETFILKLRVVAKSNSLTCVDEILKFNVFNYESLDIGYDDTWNFWQKVKQEIEKL